MGGTLAPSPWFTALDNVGVVIPSARLFFYDSGTSTKRSVFTDAGLTVAHPNPLTVDASGRAVIYMSPTSYKMVLAPAGVDDPPTSPIKTVDPVGAVPATNVDVDVPGSAGETLTAGQVVFLSDGSAGLTAGRWYMADATRAYSSIMPQSVGMVQATIASGSSGNIRLDGRITGLAGLSVGSTYFVSETSGAITTTEPLNARVVGVADSATSIILTPTRRADWVARRVKFTATTGNVGAGEDTLATWTTGQNELWANAQGLIGRFWGQTANNANAKTLRIRIVEGANNNELLNFALTASEAGRWDLQFEITRISSTTFIAVATTMVGPGGGPTSRIGTNMYGAAAPGTATFDNGVEIRITAEATTTNDVTMFGGTIYANN